MTTAATQAALNAEIAARKAADTNEASIRAATVGAEGTARLAADTALAARVTALENTVKPPSDLQAAINAAPSGGTVNATGGVYHQRVTISKPLTLIGGTIDGTGLGVPLQQGVLTVTAPVTLVGVRCTGSAGAGLAVVGASDVLLSGCELDNNVQEGYTVNSGCARVTFRACHIHHNNVALSVDRGWEAGGGKVSNSSAVLFDGCEADHNGGPGIWYDIDNTAAEVRNCRCHDNVGAGIMFEISDGASIHDNVVWACGTPTDGWYWPAGILISSSSDALVANNVVGHCQVGIAVLSQDRAPWNAVHGNVLTGNTIVMDAPKSGSECAAISVAQDFAGTVETTRAASNRFWFPSAEPQYNRFGMWGGATLDTLAKLNAASLTTAPNSYLATAPSVP